MSLLIKRFRACKGSSAALLPSREALLPVLSLGGGSSGILKSFKDFACGDTFGREIFSASVFGDPTTPALVPEVFS